MAFSNMFEINSMLLCRYMSQNCLIQCYEWLDVGRPPSSFSCMYQLCELQKTATNTYSPYHVFEKVFTSLDHWESYIRESTSSHTTKVETYLDRESNRKHNADGCEQFIVGLNSDSPEGSTRPNMINPFIMVKDTMAKMIHKDARTTQQIDFHWYYPFQYMQMKLTMITMSFIL